MVKAVFHRDLPHQIRRIGCIHFDMDGGNPISTIKTALTRFGQDVSDALIVLPEALDLGSGYYTEKAAPVFEISELKSLSRSFNVAFVAGLTDKSCFHKPYNATFLIDAQRVRRLSRKMNRGPGWYKPSSGHAQCISYRGLTIVALVCQDAEEFVLGRSGKDGELQQRVLNCLRHGQIENSPVLCVPARMAACTPSSVANAWPQDLSVVVANVKVKNEGWSGTRLANGEWKPCREGICLEPLPGLSPI